jgi:hypothetical protein
MSLDIQESTSFTQELAEAIATVVVRGQAVVMIPCLGVTDDVVRELRTLMGPRIAIDLRMVGPQAWLRFEPGGLGIAPLAG